MSKKLPDRTVFLLLPIPINHAFPGRSKEIAKRYVDMYEFSLKPKKKNRAQTDWICTLQRHPSFYSNTSQTFTIKITFKIIYASHIDSFFLFNIFVNFQNVIESFYMMITITLSTEVSNTY